MKSHLKRVTMFILILTLATNVVLCAACNRAHGHKYARDWSYDNAAHWHAATCEHTTLKSEVDAHTLVDDKCTVCGYERKVLEKPEQPQAHQHRFEDWRWIMDEQAHWRAATCEHVDEKGEYAEHNFKGRLCEVCKYPNPNYVPGEEIPDLEPGVDIGYGRTETGEDGFDYIAILDDYGDTVAYSISRGDNYNQADIIIPKTYKNLPVIEIYDSAFSECTALRSVQIPESIIRISEGAFKNSGLRSIEIPDSVKSLGIDCFRECYSLSSVVIGANVSSIGYNAFMNCNINYLEIRDINTYATIDFHLATDNPILKAGGKFYHNGQPVTSVKIEGVERIGNFAFAFSNLVSVEIGEGVKVIGTDSFSFSRGISEVTIGDDLERVEGAQFGAFGSCSALRKVTIGKGLKRIGDFMFYMCYNLESVDLRNVEYVGAHAFWGGYALKEVYLGTNLKVLDEQCFFSTLALKEIHYDGTVEDWKKVLKVGSWTGNSSMMIIPSSGDSFSIWDAQFM